MTAPLRGLADRLRGWQLRRQAERLARQREDRRVYCDPIVKDDDTVRRLRLRGGA